MHPEPARVLVPFALVCALAIGVDPARAQRLAVRTYTTADGLAGDDIRALLQDSRGFLWIGTSTGLSRFDGGEFRNYSTTDGLPHPSVNALLQDRQAALWIGTSGGLARIRPGERRFETVAAEPLRGGDVRLLHEARDGRIWVSAGTRLMVLTQKGTRLDVTGVPVTLPTAPPAGAMWEFESITEDRDGCLWIGSTWGLIQRRADGRTHSWRIRPSPRDDRIYHLSIDRNNRLWITHWGISHRPGVNWGVYVLDLAAAETGVAQPLHEFARAKNVRAASELATPDRVSYVTAGGPLGEARLHGAFPTRDGSVWFGTENGIVQLTGGGLHRYGEENGLGSPIRIVTEDREGNLWLGGRGSGLTRLEPAGLQTFTSREGFRARGVSAIVEDRAGRLCVSGTTADGARWFGAFSGDRFTSFMPRGTANVAYWGWGWRNTILQDRAGEWWLATGSGLFRYPAVDSCLALGSVSPKAVYGRAHGLSSPEVFRIFEDSRGDIWITTFGDPAMFRWRRDRGTFEPLHQIGRRAATAFADDRSGSIWMGFYSGGLTRFRNGRSEWFDATRGVPEGFVEDLHVDRSGRLWIATHPGGLARLDDPQAAIPRFERLPQDSRIGGGRMLAIGEDGWGQLYVADGRGVARLDPAMARMRRYSTADGLASNYVRITYRDRRGTLWFGTEQGLSRLRPALDVLPPAPPVFISSLRIGGLPQPVSQLGVRSIGHLTLEPPLGRLEIEYGAASLVPGEQLRYQTKLEGVDEDWSEPVAARTTLYASLAGGTYRFLVRAIAADGHHGLPAEVTFTVLPPVWRRGWFLTVTGMLTVAVAAIVYRARVARLLALERVRTRIASDLHDDLGARLSRISILAEVATRDIDRDPPSARRLLENVGDTARGLIEAAADIAWSIDPRHEDLRSLVARIRRFASDMFDGRGIRWTFEAPNGDAARIELSPEHRRQVLLVFQEAVNNIVRHADASRVMLSLRIRDRLLEAEIVDDGKGFDPGARSGNGLAGDDRGGNGLLNMEARARALKGTFRVESAPGGGTRVLLSVPVG